MAISIHRYLISSCIMTSALLKCFQISGFRSFRFAGNALGWKGPTEALRDGGAQHTPLCPRSATATSTWRSGCGGTCGGRVPCSPTCSCCWQPPRSPAPAPRTWSGCASRWVLRASGRLPALGASPMASAEGKLQGVFTDLLV